MAHSNFKNEAGKRVCIVFTETGLDMVQNGQSGKRFEVTLEGFDKERLSKISSDEWSSSEFFGFRCFKIVQDVLKKCGAA